MKKMKQITSTSMLYRFRLSFLYIALSCLFFVVCVLIVLYARELWTVRWWIWDVVIILLLYVIIKSIIEVPPIVLISIIVILAIVIEVLQYFQLVQIMWLESNSLARLIIGSVFDFQDILSYLVGGGLCVLLEKSLWKTISVMQSRS